MDSRALVSKSKLCSDYSTTVEDTEKDSLGNFSLRITALAISSRFSSISFTKHWKLEKLIWSFAKENINLIGKQHLVRVANHFHLCMHGRIKEQRDLSIVWYPHQQPSSKRFHQTFSYLFTSVSKVSDFDSFVNRGPKFIDDRSALGILSSFSRFWSRFWRLCLDVFGFRFVSHRHWVIELYAPKLCWVSFYWDPKTLQQ